MKFILYDFLQQYCYQELGGNPVIRGSYSTYGKLWIESYVYYGVNLCETIKTDINAEYKAIEEYQKHIRAIADPCIQAELQRIILDEKVHIRLFNQALTNSVLTFNLLIFRIFVNVNIVKNKRWKM